MEVLVEELMQWDLDEMNAGLDQLEKAVNLAQEIVILQAKKEKKSLVKKMTQDLLDLLVGLDEEF